MTSNFKSVSYLIDKSKSIINSLIYQTIKDDLPNDIVYNVSYESVDSGKGVINIAIVQKSQNRLLDGSILLNGEYLLNGKFRS